MFLNPISRRTFFAFSGVTGLASTTNISLARTSSQPSEPYKNQETKVRSFISDLYTDEQKYAASATDNNSSLKPLIVILLPGVYHNLDRTAKLCEQCVGYLKDAGESAVVIIPGGRGNGSVFQGYGQIDVFEAIKNVSTIYAIDKDRISVMGGSMGGAATWYMTSHYPDFFSAAAPFAGYCDYRLWKKPGGDIFPLKDWEEFSWKSRSASDCVENYCNTSVWILHGEWDRSIGGGVDVIHSRTMAEKFKTLDLNYKYSELKGRGHNAFDSKAEYFKEVVLWLIQQKRVTYPKKVKLVCHELRYNKNNFISIEQLTKYGEPGYVEAEFMNDGSLIIKSKNVRSLLIAPLSDRGKATLNIDNDRFEKLDLTKQKTLLIKKTSSWEISPAETIPVNEKHNGASGPFSDIFFERTAVLYGTNGSEAENHILEQMGTNAVGFYNQWNGGVHRGVIKGENEVPMPVIKDKDSTDKIEQNYNLFCIGTPENNSLLKKYIDRLPIEFKAGEIIVGGKSFKGKDVAVITVLPHPENPKRYIGVLGGVTFDAISWASHLNLALLPDYLVFDRDTVIEWGFFDNNWKI